MAPEGADGLVSTCERVEAAVAGEAGLLVQLPAAQPGEPDQQGSELEGVAETLEPVKRLDAVSGGGGLVCQSAVLKAGKRSWTP